MPHRIWTDGLQVEPNKSRQLFVNIPSTRNIKSNYLQKIRVPGGSTLQDVEKPTPKDNEVLVKVHTASINALDWHLLSAASSSFA
jgi:hypothetical protein